MRTLCVLLTNNTLAKRAGSESYLRDVALSLLRRGHRPVAFSMVHGAVAEELRRATVPVVDDLTRIGQPPDVIHGHHHLETLIAALTFPDVPIVHFCHGWIPWEEKPLRHPSIRRYVAVDEVCADRLIHEEGIPRDAVETLFNFVDLARFRPRGPLPERPRRALVFSNQATTEGYVRQVSAACEAQGIQLDIRGDKAGNPVDTPELLLTQYDIVFAKARSALEAMAVGCAVVLTDAVGCGPLVTRQNFDRLRARNFGVRELYQPHDAEWYTKQIAGYDARDAAAVTERVRAEADLEAAVDRIVALYLRAIESPPAEGCAGRAAASHLQTITRPFKDAWNVGVRLRISEEDVRLARAERDAANAERAVLAGRLQAVQDCVKDLEASVATLETSLESARRRAAVLEETTAQYRNLTALRLRDAVLRLPLVGPTARLAARALRRARNR